MLADTSGSMSVDGKIEALNKGLKDMISSFAGESRLRAEIQVSVITFGGSQVELNLPLTPAHQLQSFTPLVAEGMTPLGGALSLASEMIEDKDSIPSRAYKPVIVLVSDGYPNDDWQGPFARLVNGERSSRPLALPWPSAPMRRRSCSATSPMTLRRRCSMPRTPETFTVSSGQ